MGESQVTIMPKGCVGTDDPPPWQPGCTQEITITAPVLKFEVGDVVKRKNTCNNKSVFVRVESREICGTWTWSAENVSWVWVDKARYGITVVQSGSYHNNSDATPMRPGIILSEDADDLERFETVDPVGEVCVADSDENIDARNEAWKREQATRVG